jgi:hypothetical protein
MHCVGPTLYLPEWLSYCSVLPNNFDNPQKMSGNVSNLLREETKCVLDTRDEEKSDFDNSVAVVV